MEPNYKWLGFNHLIFYSCYAILMSHLFANLIYNQHLCNEQSGHQPRRRVSWRRCADFVFELHPVQIYRYDEKAFIPSSDAIVASLASVFFDFL